MLKKHELENLIFFDIETATGFAELSDAPQRIQDLWEKKCVHLIRENPELDGKDPDFIYKDKAALYPEYNRIVCLSVARLHDENTTLGGASFVATDEKKLLTGVIKSISKHLADGYKLCGHNINGFDIPVLLKRCVINEVQIPPELILFNMPKWDVPLLDTQDVWASTSWKNKSCPLDTLAAVLGIDSPKDDISGANVSGVFWEYGDLGRIAKYCEKDVLTTANVVLKLAYQPIVKETKWHE